MVAIFALSFLGNLLVAGFSELLIVRGLFKAMHGQNTYRDTNSTTLRLLTSLQIRSFK